MLNFKPLYDEMDAQKQIIESKGGSVTISANKIKPSEITEGIKTISVPDFSSSTATESDVRQGVTFYSGNTTLKVGTMEDKGKFYEDYIIRNNPTSERLNYYLPEDVTVIKDHTFRGLNAQLDFYFSEGIQEIGAYAFHGSTNIRFMNFIQLQNLKKVGNYSFVDCGPIDLTQLPSSIESIGDRTFQNQCIDGSSIILPENLKTLGQYAFFCDNKRYLSQLVFPAGYTDTTLPNYSFQYISFNCDFSVPQSCTTVGSYFNYRGSFNNIEIHSNCRTINSYSFGGHATDVQEEYKLKTVTIYAETPPSFGNNVFASQNVKNNFKIYVPDNSVDAYKAVTKLSAYKDCIYPISQKA